MESICSESTQAKGVRNTRSENKQTQQKLTKKKKL